MWSLYNNKIDEISSIKLVDIRAGKTDVTVIEIDEIL